MYAMTNITMCNEISCFRVGSWTWRTREKKVGQLVTIVVLVSFEFYVVLFRLSKLTAKETGHVILVTNKSPYAVC